MIILLVEIEISSEFTKSYIVTLGRRLLKAASGQLPGWVALARQRLLVNTRRSFGGAIRKCFGLMPAKA